VPGTRERVTESPTSSSGRPVLASQRGERGRRTRPLARWLFPSPSPFSAPSAERNLSLPALLTRLSKPGLVEGEVSESSARLLPGHEKALSYVVCALPGPLCRRRGRGKALFTRRSWRLASVPSWPCWSSPRSVPSGQSHTFGLPREAPSVDSALRRARAASSSPSPSRRVRVGAADGTTAKPSQSRLLGRSAHPQRPGRSS